MLEGLTVSRPRRKRRRLRRWLVGSGAVLVVALLIIGLDLFIRYLPAAHALRDGQDAITQVRGIVDAGVGNLDSSKLDELDALLSRAQTDFGPKSQVIGSSWLLDIAGRLPWLGDQVTALRAMRSTGGAGAQLGLDLVPVLRAAIPPPRGSSSSTLARLVTLAESGAAALDRVLRDLDAVDSAAGGIPATAGLLGPLGSGRSLVQSLLPRVDGALRPAIGLLRVLPQAAGPGQHRYLLLLDNPGEQRPGGGFIGAVGEVTLTQGTVLDRNFRGSEFANPLVTSIPAPRGLNETLFRGQPWQLSDSNWSPDFPTSAAAAAHFYELATGHAVDGVIGVDPIALSYVLAVTGEVSAPSYTQAVGAQDTLLVLNEIINRARPGDPGKAYLAPFGAAMLDRILTAPLSQDAGIAAALLRGAQEKHIVMSFNDATLMAKTDGAGFSGRLADPPSDALQISDANVGGNKADLFVTRKYSFNAVVTADGQVRDTLTLQYTNPRQSDPALSSLVSQYSGEYRDYLRVYIPETASLQSLTLAHGPSVGPVTPEGTDFELQRQAIDYLLVVPAGQTATLTLTYSGPFVDTSLTPLQYHLDWAKEIGAPAWPVTVAMRVGGRTANSTSDLNVDRSWTISAG